MDKELINRQQYDRTMIITNKCNLDCVMCPQERESNDIDIIEKNNINLLKNKRNKISHICITGGEPTLYWDYFVRLILAIKRYRYKTPLQILTNGIVLEDYNKVLEISKTFNSDTLICIPLHSDIDNHHDSITSTKGSFWKTIQGIRNLAINKIPVEIRIVLLKLNIERIIDISDFIYNHFPFISHVAFMGLEPVFKAKQHYDTFKIDLEQLNTNLIKACNNLHLRDIPVSIYNIPLCHLERSLWPFCEKSISEWKRFYPLCNECTLRGICGGVFSSYKGITDYSIRPILEVLDEY